MFLTLSITTGHFACVYYRPTRKLIVFNFNSWLIFSDFVIFYGDSNHA